jgi:L-alanine-DL-glutamate epimerase-like enolase superfamily enzyme
MFTSGLRKDLVADQHLPVDGRIPLPSEPGLGVTLDDEAIEHYRVMSATLPG